MTNENHNIYQTKIKKYTNSIKVYSYRDPKIKPLKSKQKTHLNLRTFNKLSEDEIEQLREENLRGNIYKVRTRIYDLIFNNDFDYFVTLTFDPTVEKQNGLSKQEQNDLRYDEMKKWLDRLRQQAKRRGKEFRYFFVPELHTGKGENSGTIHWHGLIGGYCPELVDSGKKYDGYTVFNLVTWEYGYSNVQRIRSKKRTANYVRKYITKDLMNSPVRKNKKKYWASKNLKKPELEIIEEHIDWEKKLNREPDWCSDDNRVEIFEMTKEEYKKIAGEI